MTTKTINTHEELADYVKNFTKAGVKAFLDQVGYDVLSSDEEIAAMRESLEIFGQFLLSNYMNSIAVEFKEND